MALILRKNLTRFFSNHSAAVSSTLLLLLLRRDFSISHSNQGPKLAISPHSPSHLSNRPEHTSGEPHYSALSFLQDCGFSDAQLKKILKYKPGYLLKRTTLEGCVKPKIRALQSLELSPHEIAKIISGNPPILCDMKMLTLITSISTLKEFVGSNAALAKLLNRSSWVLRNNLERILFPNVEFLKSCGVPKERILKFLFTWPRCLLLKPEVIRKSVEKLKKMGASPTSNMFIYALQVVSGASSKTLVLKLQAFRDFGFSESDTRRLFQVAPHLLTRSRKQLEQVKDAILATGKYDISCIIKCPSILSYNMANSENKLKEPVYRVG